MADGWSPCQARAGGCVQRARPAGEGGGIDATFSAPKSVSTVWALGDPWQREQIEAAHARAVEKRPSGIYASRCRSCAVVMTARSWRSTPRT